MIQVIPGRVPINERIMRESIHRDAIFAPSLFEDVDATG